MLVPDRGIDPHEGFPRLADAVGRAAGDGHAAPESGDVTRGRHVQLPLGIGSRDVGPRCLQSHVAGPPASQSPEALRVLQVDREGPVPVLAPRQGHHHEVAVPIGLRGLSVHRHAPQRRLARQAEPLELPLAVLHHETRRGQHLPFLRQHARELRPVRHRVEDGDLVVARRVQRPCMVRSRVPGGVQHRTRDQRPVRFGQFHRIHRAQRIAQGSRHQRQSGGRRDRDRPGLALRIRGVRPRGVHGPPLRVERRVVGHHQRVGSPDLVLQRDRPRVVAPVLAPDVRARELGVFPMGRDPDAELLHALVHQREPQRRAPADHAVPDRHQVEHVRDDARVEPVRRQRHPPVGAVGPERQQFVGPFGERRRRQFARARGRRRLQLQSGLGPGTHQGALPKRAHGPQCLQFQRGRDRPEALLEFDFDATDAQHPLPELEPQPPVPRLPVLQSVRLDRGHHHPPGQARVQGVDPRPGHLEVDPVPDHETGVFQPARDAAGGRDLGLDPGQVRPQQRRPRVEPERRGLSRTRVHLAHALVAVEPCHHVFRPDLHRPAFALEIHRRRQLHRHVRRQPGHRLLGQQGDLHRALHRPQKLHRHHLHPVDRFHLPVAQSVRLDPGQGLIGRQGDPQAGQAPLQHLVPDPRRQAHSRRRQIHRDPRVRRHHRVALHLGRPPLPPQRQPPVAAQDALHRVGADVLRDERCPRLQVQLEVGPVRDGRHGGDGGGRTDEGELLPGFGPLDLGPQFELEPVIPRLGNHQPEAAGRRHDAPTRRHFRVEDRGVALEQQRRKLVGAPRIRVQRHLEGHPRVVDPSGVADLVEQQVGGDRTLGRGGRRHDPRRTRAARQDLETVQDRDATRSRGDHDPDGLSGLDGNIAEHDVLRAFAPRLARLPTARARSGRRPGMIRAGMQGEHAVLFGRDVGRGPAVQVEVVTARGKTRHGHEDVAAVGREHVAVQHRVARGIAPDAGRVGDRQGDRGRAAVGEPEVLETPIGHRRHSGDEPRFVMPVQVPVVIGSLPRRGETGFRAGRARPEIDVQQALGAQTERHREQQESGQETAWVRHGNLPGSAVANRATRLVAREPPRGGPRTNPARIRWHSDRAGRASSRPPRHPTVHTPTAADPVHDPPPAVPATERALEPPGTSRDSLPDPYQAFQ